MSLQTDIRQIGDQALAASRRMVNLGTAKKNKILEAMAMCRPVVAAQSCVEAIDARDGDELVSAAEPADFVREIDALLKSPQRAAAVGRAGRERVLQSYSWDAHLSRIDSHLNPKASA